jgi:hypothetical protein
VLFLLWFWPATIEAAQGGKHPALPLFTARDRVRRKIAVMSLFI